MLEALYDPTVGQLNSGLPAGCLPP